jgi:hypothetical protein
MVLAGCSAAAKPGSPAPAGAAPAGVEIAAVVEAEGGDPSSREAPDPALDVRRAGTKVTVLPKARVGTLRDLGAFLKAADDFLERSRAGPRIYRLTLTGASLTPARAAQAFQAAGIRGVTASVSGPGGQTSARRLESPEELTRTAGLASAYGAAPPTQLTYYVPRDSVPRLLLIARTDAPVLQAAAAAAR